METHKNSLDLKKLQFLVLIPHRDSLFYIDEYRQDIFGKGFKGAWSFPAAVPLAIVTGILNRGELIVIAHGIRSLTAANDGKISAGRIGFTRFPDFIHTNENRPDCSAVNKPDPWRSVVISGPLLDLPPLHDVPGLSINKVVHVFSESVLCAAVLDSKESVLPEIKPFSFRAAMISSLIIRPINGVSPYSFKWRFGPEYWLPAPGKERCLK